MSKLTGLWKSRLRPVLFNGLARRLGLGVPAPHASIRLDALAAGGGCECIPLDRGAGEMLPVHPVTGDLDAVEQVRSRIIDPVALAAYDRQLRGTGIQVQSDPIVAVLPDGRVTHGAGIVTTAGNEFVPELSGLDCGSDNPTSPLRLDRWPPPRRDSRTVAVLTTGYSHNYYHWLTEALPRLDLYERSGLAGDARFFAPIRYRFQAESLAWLGIERSRIVPATTLAHVSAQHLVSSNRIVSTRRTTDFLYRRLTAVINAGPDVRYKIFISRTGRGVRRIVNESDVMRVLRPLGFVAVRLEKLSLAKQVGMFHAAECVVGPHGAGLTNLVLCRPGTPVVEIGTPYRPSLCFSEIAHHRGLEYQLHMARPVNVRHFDPRTAVGDSNLFVDAAALRAVVADLLTPRTRTVRLAA